MNVSVSSNNWPNEVYKTAIAAVSALSKSNFCLYMIMLEALVASNGFLKSLTSIRTVSFDSRSVPKMAAFS